MRISSIPQIYRNVNRWTEILSVLSKYGLAGWLSRFNLELTRGLLKDAEGGSLTEATHEERIRMALAELGPVFIKLGQMLSTRPDLVGFRLADELKRLQTDVPPDKPDVVRKTLQAELGQPLEDLFAQFDLEPIASASIGQVHAAQLKTGERVVVKVQRHGIHEKVREDTEILSGLAQLAERLPELAPYRPVAVAAEFQRALRRELDFGREERNLQQFHDALSDDPKVHVPLPFSEYCTPRVLTMERLEGIKFSDGEALAAAGVDLDAVARHGAELYVRMIFTNGHYHADPHPGNLVLEPGEVIGMLDFGSVGRIDETLRENIESLLLAVAYQDAEQLTAIIRRVGTPPSDLDETALRNDVADFVAHYATQSLDRFDLGGALREMTELIHRYRITLPVPVAMLLKVLITLEGTAKLLSPKFSVVEVIKPLRHRILLRRFSPARRARKFRRLYGEIEYVAEYLPRRILDIIEQVRGGQFNVQLDHHGLEPSVNRLVYGMITSALFLGSSLMMAYKVPPLLLTGSPWFGWHDVSMLGLAGQMLSVVLGLRLLRAIAKSGRLEERGTERQRPPR